ncbi:MAG: hypothetical protein ABSC23_03660 [Bryobacteraceae bacterium]
MSTGRNVNSNLNLLASRYGNPHIDYFPSSSTWRIWFYDWHVHHGIGSHGSFAVDGATLEAAIMRVAESVKRHPPQQGEHCRRGCPHYSDDLY